MNRSVRTALGVVAVTATFAIATPRAAMASEHSTHRHWADFGHQTGTFNVNTFAVHLAGPFRAPGFGHSTTDSNEIGTTWSFSRGDALVDLFQNFTDATGITCPADHPIPSRDIERVTGGTGRFTGATGWISTESCEHDSAPDANGDVHIDFMYHTHGALTLHGED